jgi:hypothetical protein
VAGDRGSTADFAVEAHPDLEASRVDAPASRTIKPLAKGEKPDQLAEKTACAEDRQEALLDEAIEETFPGSDPISPKHITYRPRMPVNSGMAKNR